MKPLKLQLDFRSGSNVGNIRGHRTVLERRIAKVGFKVFDEEPVQVLSIVDVIHDLTSGFSIGVVQQVLVHLVWAHQQMPPWWNRGRLDVERPSGLVGDAPQMMANVRRPDRRVYGGELTARFQQAVSPIEHRGKSQDVL